MRDRQSKVNLIPNEHFIRISRNTRFNALGSQLSKGQEDKNGCGKNIFEVDNMFHNLSNKYISFLGGLGVNVLLKFFKKKPIQDGWAHFIIKNQIRFLLFFVFGRFLLVEIFFEIFEFFKSKPCQTGDILKRN